MIDQLPAASYMFVMILLGILISLVSVVVAVKVANKFGLVDIPGSAPHKQHLKPTPMAGGIAILISLLLMVFISGLWTEKKYLLFLISAVVVFFVGAWDDKHSLSPALRFGIQVLAAVLVIKSGLYIRIFEYPLFNVGGPLWVYDLLDKLLTVIWIVGITNAINLVDSMDGLAVGLSGWAFAFFMLATFDSQQQVLSIFSALMAGICAGTYLFNSRPAKLFLGDSGALFLGFILSVLAIEYTPIQSFQGSSWFAPILLLAVPIYDTCLVTFSRARRGLPIYRSNRDHTYHRLINAGVDPARVVNIMHTATLTLACFAFVAISFKPLYANLTFLGIILGGIVLFFYLDQPKFLQK